MNNDYLEILKEVADDLHKINMNKMDWFISQMTDMEPRLRIKEMIKIQLNVGQYYTLREKIVELQLKLSQQGSDI